MIKASKKFVRADSNAKPGQWNVGRNPFVRKREIEAACKRLCTASALGNAEIGATATRNFIYKLKQYGLSMDEINEKLKRMGFSQIRPKPKKIKKEKDHGLIEWWEK